MSIPKDGKDELVGYWFSLHEQRGTVPEFQIVCHPGAPDWLNKYVNTVQRRAMNRALRACPELAGLDILDVGCGTGRWSTHFRDLGGSVLGIDVSQAAISRSIQEISGVDFCVSDVANLELNRQFDVISSVTVLQHLRPADQERAAARLVTHLKPNGYVVLLENTRDEGTHVFARPIDGWKRIFESHGVTNTLVEGYEYAYPIRMARWIAKHVARISHLPSNTDPLAPHSSDAGRAARMYRSFLLRFAVWLSACSERVFAAYLPATAATHVCLVFHKPAN